MKLGKKSQDDFSSKTANEKDSANNSIQQDIYSFVFAETNKPGEFYEGTEFLSIDDKYCYIFVRLTSSQIEEKNNYLNDTLQKLEESFNKNQVETDIFERMKHAIYESGDFLAENLHTNFSDLEDVDYSTSFALFDGNEIYVWIDGSLNMRIYRGEESLVVNEDFSKEQFWGSTIAEVGDIFVLTTNEYIENYDARNEEYVLEKASPDYPSLFIDYQTNPENLSEEEHHEDKGVEENQHEIGEQMPENLNEETTAFAKESNNKQTKLNKLNEIDNLEAVADLDGHAKPAKEYLTDESSYNQAFEPEKEFSTKEKSKSSQSGKSKKSKFAFINTGKESLQNFTQNKALQNFGGNAKVTGLRLGSVVNSYLSNMLDWVYLNILRKNKQQLKTFQNSQQKIYLKFLIIGLVVVLVSYSFLSLISSGGDDPANTEGQGTAQQGDQEANGHSQLLAQIQENSNNLQTFFDSANVQNYNTLYEQTLSQIQEYTSNSDDASGIQTAQKIEQQINTNYYQLNGIEPIDKVDQIYLGESIEGVNISDFEVVGDTIYAVDKGNNQILTSNGNQGFDVFLTNENFTSLNQIICLDNNTCYIDDAQAGIISFNLSTKEVGTHPQLESFGVGVQDMGEFRDNFYTLVPENSAVYRFATTNNGATISTPLGTWNSGGFDEDTADFVIDGSIYELTQSGELIRYFGGSPTTPDSNDYAELEQANPSLSENILVETTEAREANGVNRNRFYIADSDNKMISVYDKDPNLQKYPYLGKYMYVGTEAIGFTNFKEIVLSDDELFVYLLEEQNIYRITVDKL